MELHRRGPIAHRVARLGCEFSSAAIPHTHRLDSLVARLPREQVDTQAGQPTVRVLPLGTARPAPHRPSAEPGGSQMQATPVLPVPALEDKRMKRPSCLTTSCKYWYGGRYIVAASPGWPPPPRKHRCDRTDHAGGLPCPGFPSPRIHNPSGSRDHRGTDRQERFSDRRSNGGNC